MQRKAQIDSPEAVYHIIARGIGTGDYLAPRPTVPNFLSVWSIVLNPLIGELYRRLGKKEEALSEFDTANGMYRALGMTYHMHPQALIK
jgi:hypothetical protein